MVSCSHEGYLQSDRTQTYLKPSENNCTYSVKSAVYSHPFSPTERIHKMRQIIVTGLETITIFKFFRDRGERKEKEWEKTDMVTLYMNKHPHKGT